MYKQVIVVRKDLKIRKGKFISQGAHAAIGAYQKALEWQIKAWEDTGSTKICLYVNSEEELEEIYKKGVENKLPCYLVVDEGRTEFNGVKTKTAVAIGPAKSEEVDKITGHLDLF